MHHGKTKVNQSHFMLDMVMVLYTHQQCRLTQGKIAAMQARSIFIACFAKN